MIKTNRGRPKDEGLPQKQFELIYWLVQDSIKWDVLKLYEHYDLKIVTEKKSTIITSNLGKYCDKLIQQGYLKVKIREAKKTSFGKEQQKGVKQYSLTTSPKSLKKLFLEFYKRGKIFTLITSKYFEINPATKIIFDEFYNSYCKLFPNVEKEFYKYNVILDFVSYQPEIFTLYCKDSEKFTNDMKKTFQIINDIFVKKITIGTKEVTTDYLILLSMKIFGIIAALNENNNNYLEMNKIALQNTYNKFLRKNIIKNKHK